MALTGSPPCFLLVTWESYLTPSRTATHFFHSQPDRVKRSKKARQHCRLRSMLRKAYNCIVTGDGSVSTPCLSVDSLSFPCLWVDCLLVKFHEEDNLFLSEVS
jgi:hypothetical protein